MKIKHYLLFLCLFLAAGSAHADQRILLSQYAYEDTRQLVLLVEDAAALIGKNGETVFKEFSKKGSRWLNGECYMFIYDTQGKCVFHPIEPSLIGQNLIKFEDVDGRPAIRMITDVAKKSAADASGWVFYKWEDPWCSSFPQWKSSYIRKAVAPDGNVYAVGCGLYNMKIEKVFIQQQVDKAVELIREKGPRTAFKLLTDPASSFDIMDSYIVVINSTGTIEVNPVFPVVGVSRNWSNIVDKTGRNISEMARQALLKSDQVWISYLWPKGDAAHLARKLMYINRIKVGKGTYYIAMDFFPAMPIWMK